MLRRTLLVLLLATLSASVLAQRYATGEEVMDAVEAQQSPTTMIATMSMTITSGSGQSLSREMRIWTADGGDRQVVKFTAPADIAGSGFLSEEAPDGSSESMIYLPAIDRVRRIAGGQEQESFFGSDFSYDDISSLAGDLGEDYVHELADVLDGPVYVVEATPKEGADPTYDRLVYTVPEDTLVPTRIEFYRGGEQVKAMTIDATTSVGDYVLPSEFRMETLATGSFTTIEQRDVTVDDEIPDDVFTERFLRR